MNSGYLSLIVMIVTVILFASGWKSAVVPGVRDRTIVWFILCWLLLSRIHIQWPGASNVEINLVLLLVLIFTMKHIGTRSSWLAGLHLVSIGLFLASLFYLLRHLSQADPLFFPYHSPSAAAIPIGIVAVLLCRKAEDQLTVVSFGLLAGTALYTLGPHHTFPVVLGGSVFQDQWWMAVATARSVSLCLESAWSLGAEAVRSWQAKSERKRDGRNDIMAENRFSAIQTQVEEREKD